MENKRWFNWSNILNIILVILLLVLVLYKTSLPKEPTQDNGGVQMGVIEVGGNSDEIQSKVNEIVSKGMFQIFINTDIKIDNNNIANVMIQNNKNNNYSCYVEILYQDEIIYKSPILDPGYKIETDEINYFNTNGTYNCIAYFRVIDKDTNRDINSIGVELDITK